MTDPATMLFLGAILRPVGATIVLSGVLVIIGRRSSPAQPRWPPSLPGHTWRAGT